MSTVADPKPTLPTTQDGASNKDLFVGNTFHQHAAESKQDYTQLLTYRT